MMRFFLVVVICFPFTGCVSSMVEDAVDAAGDQVRLKWAEEWKPALASELREQMNQGKDVLLSELKAQVSEGKDVVLSQVLERLEAYDDRLAKMGIDVASHDRDQSGKLEVHEMYGLLREIKEKNENSPQPLSWYEIMVIVAGAYLPTTALKETLKSKMAKPTATA